MTDRPLRPQYADLRACPHCGALAEKLGHIDIDIRDDTQAFVPAAIEHPCKWDAPFAEKRERIIEGRTNGRGIKQPDRTAEFHVQVHSHICTRHAEHTGDESVRFECGTLVRGSLKAFTGDVPAWAYFGGGRAVDPGIGRDLFGGAA